MKPKLIEISVNNVNKTFKLIGVPVDDALASCYIKYFLELVRAKGVRYTVRHLKEVYGEIVRFSCGLKISVSTSMWVKRDKDNFPISLKPFKKYLRQGSVLERRYALSLLRVFESIELSPIPDLETVTSPSNGKAFYASIKESFNLFLSKSIYGKYIKNIFEDARLQTLKENKDMPFHFSTKRGVEGPTCLTAGKQSLAISEEMEIKLNNFNKFFRNGEWVEILKDNQDFFTDNDDFYKTTDKSINFLGRITFVSAPGGKTRLVAIGNYWVQDVLKGLHKTLYKVLRKIVTDGTYDQTKQSDRVKLQSSKGWCWSYDLTAATDRFPIEPQIELLKHLNPEIGSLWEEILIDLNFEYKGQELRYAVGQPMGLYSSWAVFSITHHAIVQYCAFLERVPYPFEEYAILGDDVAIWNRSVALRYKSIISGFDVVINNTKSFEPLNDSINESCIAEFAKRIYVKGEEITALSPGILNQSWKSFYESPELIRYLSDHNLMPENKPVSRLIKLYGIYPKQIDELCCLFRIRECIGGPIKGLTFDIPNREYLDKITIKTVTIARCSLLAEQASDIWSELFELDDQIGQVLENRLDCPIPENLYLSKIINDRLQSVLDLEKRLIQFLPEEEYDSPIEKEYKNIPDLSDIEYLPSIDIEEMLTTMSGRPTRHRVHRNKYIQNLLKEIKKC